MIAEAGYDTAKVSSVRCISCHQPIGNLEYKEITTLARFGQMLFEHVTCPVDGEAYDENNDHNR